jgi:tetratricopeptide (TPR) repeat protein
MKRFLLLLILLPQVLLVHSQDSYHAILKAKALCSQAKPAEAVNLLTVQIGKEKNADLFCARGEAYLSEEMIQQASSDFTTAESLTPGKGLYGLARASAAAGDAKAAVGYLKALMKTDYKPNEPVIDKDSIFAKISTSNEWKMFWRQEWYKDSEKSKWQIEYYIKNGRIDLAKEEYSTLRAEYPDTYVSDYCGALIDIESGNPSSAVKRLTGAVSLPDNTDAHTVLAKAYAAQGEYYAAALEYGKLISLQYNDASVFLSRAEMLKKAGDREAAIADIDFFLSLYPEDYKALSMMGKCYAEAGDLYKALPYMNKNIELHPGEAAAFSDRGDVYFTCRSWGNAISDYSMSLDLNPSNGAAYLNMGVSLINSGKGSDACPFLRKALELGQKSAAKYISSTCGR